MEKTGIAWIYPAKFGWDDVSSWNALYDALGNGKDPLVFSPESLVSDSDGSLVFSNVKGKVVAVKGLKDFLVIDTPDALLVCPKNEPTVREFLSKLSLPQYKKYR